MHKAKTEFVNEHRRKEMRFGHIQKARMDGRIKWKIQGSRADAARQGAAERLWQVTSAKRQERFTVREEKACGEFVLPAAEFAIPVGCELVVGVFARAADGESAGGRIAAGNQKAVR